MRILFVSHLYPSASTGPNYSVPSRIEVQSYIDDVFWINLSDVVRDEWAAKSYFHSSSEFDKFTLSNIEKVFPNIDLVVFESFYNLQQVKLSHELRKHNIPYIIVPRCSLTYQALHNHSWLKKTLSSWLKEKIKVYLTKRATGMLVISKALVNYFKGQGIMNIAVINMFVDSKRFENIKTNTEKNILLTVAPSAHLKMGWIVL